jgi:hypothetical protein
MSQTTEFRGVATTVHTHKRAEGQEIVGVYHNTRVAIASPLLPDERGFTHRVTLNTGGWKSNTTKTRMNQFSAQFCGNAYRVYQDKGDWFVLVRGNEAPYVFEGDTISFDI